MVMAGTEGVSGLTTDESLSSRLQWLQQRRETLNDKLTQKNVELKNLCIEEAELTGVLPPEIPLEPGENPPTFRKKVGMNFNYSQNLINKLKTNGAEESTLELERQVQINIADAALAVLNDLSESKAMRRKHRSIYQQSQRRLQELNAQLNFIRQSHGGGPRHTQSAHIPLHSSQPQLQTTTKHRTKKPRPPLDNSGKNLSPKVESCGFLHDGGISLSPLGPEHSYNSYSSYDFQDLAGHSYLQPGSSNTSNQNRMTYHAPSPVDHRRTNTKFSEHDLNVNNNMYITPDHFRNRTYSQGGNSGSSNGASPHHFTERIYRPIPNTYSNEERQIHYRQMKMKKQENEEIMHGQKYSEPRYIDNEGHRRSAQISYHESENNTPRYDGQMHDFPAHYNHGKSQALMVLRQKDTVDNPMIGSEHKGNKRVVDSYVPPGYWMRLDDEIVWCTDEQITDRFGSLDRRKQNIMYHPSNTDTQSKYQTVAIGSKSNAIAHLKQHPLQPQVQNLESKKSSNNRILLRTQSLGSVENWQPPTSSLDGSSSVEGHESADSSTHGCTLSTKIKEKEWYETSLDSNSTTIGSTSVTQQQRAIRRTSHHNSLIGPLTKERIPVRSNSIPSNRRPREQQQQQLQSQQLEEQQIQRPPLPQNKYVENRVLEIPAESKPSIGSQENGNESILPLNSMTMIVQPGKYQPYREVTKPFEMSDFYKYSTKFRKRVEANTINEQQQQQKSTNLNTQNDQNQVNNSIQRIHQPVQQNNCPSYTLR